MIDQKNNTPVQKLGKSQEERLQWKERYLTCSSFAVEGSEKTEKPVHNVK